MSRRTPLRQEPLPDVPRREKDAVQAALETCISGRLRLVSGTCLLLGIAHPKPGQPSEQLIDLKNYVLPETALLPRCSLTDDTAIFCAMIVAVDRYLIGLGKGKNTHLSVINRLNTLAKVWEWGRINGLYYPKDWKESHFKKLKSQLQAGLWAKALDIEARAIPLIERALVIAGSYDRSEREKHAFGREVMVLRELLGTNLSARELSIVKDTFRARLNKNSYAPYVYRKHSSNSLGQTLSAVSSVGSIPAPYGFSVPPFSPQEIFKLRRSLTSGRTKNLTIDDATRIFKAAFQYVYVVAPRVVALLEIAKDVVKTSVNPRREGGRGFSETARLFRAKTDWNPWRDDSVIGKNISFYKSNQPKVDSIALPDLIACTQLSCAILMAALNARRKDEICHPTIGVNRNSLTVVNNELGVYQATFYIEKSLQSYAPFYVNQCTYDCFTVLCNLNEAQVHFIECSGASVSGVTSESLFWNCHYSPSRGEIKVAWLEFSMARTKASRKFMGDAFKDLVKPDLSGAHVFRRFYALLYFYRFQHGDLLGVRYQLAHPSTESSKFYVTDSMIQAASSRIPTAMKAHPSNVSAAISEDWSAVETELRTVGQEKLQSMIFDLLEGGSSGGGFPRLVQKLHRRLMSDLDYSQMDTDRKAKRLAGRLLARGHLIRPLPQADCVVGESSGRAAQCREQGAAGPAPENANPATCASCAYGWVAPGHIEGLKLDLEDLRSEGEFLTKESQLHSANQRAVANLERVIWLHEHRMQRPVL